MRAVAIIFAAVIAAFLAIFGAASVDSIRPSPTQNAAEELVRQLRDLPPGLTGIAYSDGRIPPIEQRRDELYRQLRQLGPDALPALARGLRDPDVRIRKNVAVVLMVLGDDWYDKSQPKLDIRPCLHALIAALGDSDSTVRAWAAQDIGVIGPAAAEAVPTLVALLKNDRDEGSRIGACIALRGIGHAAKAALPTLREALSDPSTYVRGFAKQAIDRIERQ